MKFNTEEEIREKTVISIAEKMAVGARTAPKGKGIDNLIIAIFDKDGIKKISDMVLNSKEKRTFPGFFLRDATNILSAQAMIVIGTKIRSLGITNCGLCGYQNCEEKSKYHSHPCAFNTGDLGIAIGSAVSIATDNRVDNRIMFSIGKIIVENEILGKDVKIAYAIPLSVSSKNPFFDRKIPKI